MEFQREAPAGYFWECSIFIGVGVGHIDGISWNGSDRCLSLCTSRHVFSRREGTGNGVSGAKRDVKPNYKVFFNWKKITRFIYLKEGGIVIHSYAHGIHLSSIRCWRAWVQVACSRLSVRENERKAREIWRSQSKLERNLRMCLLHFLRIKWFSC